MLTLSPDAMTAWVKFFNDTERELLEGGELCRVRDVASKIADCAARIAALFHVFAGGVGPISLDAIKRASCIAAWHLSESVRYFSELSLPQDLADAVKLDAWLVRGRKPVSRRDAQRLGPIRDGKRIDEAVEILVELNRAKCDPRDPRKLMHPHEAVLE